MRQGFNQISIPYMNELTARSIGAASVFNGNMPVSYVNFSLNRLASLFQQKQDKVEVMPPGYDPSTGMPYPKPSTKKIPSTGRTQADDIFGLPDYSQSRTPPIAGAQEMKKCDANSSWLDRLLGRCCVGEVVNGECVLTSDGKGGAVGGDETGKKIEDMLGGVTNAPQNFIVLIVGLIILVIAIISLR